MCDPVFTAIYRHDQAYAAFLLAGDDVTNESEQAAYNRLLQTPPMTTGGACAVIDYILGCDRNRELGDEGGIYIDEYKTFLRTLAGALRTIGAP
jgi:hypothetical protein